MDLSQRAQRYDQELQDVDKEFDIRRKDKEKEHQEAFKKISLRERHRIEAYQKNQEEILEKMQEKYQAAIEEPRKRAES